MTADAPVPQKSQPIQNNYGNGAFIGGDQHGDINIHHEIDPKTKATLAKLGKSAPRLSQMLENALRDGIISPDTASQLSVAARSINEDVADRLTYASHRINEDVAGLLTHASRSINEDVASQIAHAADQLSQLSTRIDFESLDNLARRLEGILGSHNNGSFGELAVRLESSIESLGAATDQMNHLKGGSIHTAELKQVTLSLAEIAKRVEARVTPPPPIVLPDWEGRLRWLGIGIFLGIAISIIFAAYS
ncbi:hypothetical protein [Kitasatospora sp. NPDC087314]|uniref:hypothetical protein n=1 Tax=Kitasatospora sp. NPDC087314 TaxID=3364068 RepID=UPI003804EB90